MAQATCVCAYDRAGLGWSDAGPMPRDGAHLAADLHALLANAGIAGPYVLVGHSYGGLYVRAFASQYANEVAGLVLLDSAHPDKCTRTPEGAARYTMDARIYGVSRVLARFGLLRLGPNLFAATPLDWPADVRAERQVTLALLAGMSVSASLGPVVRMGQTVTETQSVEAVNATDASVQIQMNAGVLTLAGGADHLLDADFRYNVPDWEPQVAYALDGAHGALDVTQPDKGRLPVGGELVNDWSLRLNDGLPLDLAIDLGAGEAALDLTGLDVTKVQVETGAAVVTVDLRGNWDHDVNVAITGGAGELRVVLPSALGVRVTANTALVNLTASGLTRDGDTYVNATYGTAPYSLHVKIVASVGAVDLEVR